MGLSVSKVIKEAAIQRAKPKPLPKVVMKVKVVKPEINITVDDSQWVEKSNVLLEQVQQLNNDIERTLLQKLESEYSDVRMERDKLSTRISFLVEEGATPERLMQHYNEIESYRQPLKDYYDKIEYIKRNGCLPAESDPDQEKTLFELKDQKRKLVDKRCKLQVKLKPSAKAQKPERLIMWQLELEQANAEYEEVEKLIKKMSGKA